MERAVLPQGGFSVNGFRAQAFGLPRKDGAVQFTNARNDGRQASY
jgi:hypothetical protein